jgi:hypothetical protein
MPLNIRSCTVPICHAVAAYLFLQIEAIRSATSDMLLGTEPVMTTIALHRNGEAKKVQVCVELWPVSLLLQSCKQWCLLISKGQGPPRSSPSSPPGTACALLTRSQVCFPVLLHCLLHLSGGRPGLRVAPAHGHDPGVKPTLPLCLPQARPDLTVGQEHE